MARLAQLQELSSGDCATLGINCAGGGADNTASFSAIIFNVADFFALIVIALAALFLVYAGFLYVTSRGDESQAATAKRQIAYAFIGIIIASFYLIILVALEDAATAPIPSANAIITIIIRPLVDFLQTFGYITAVLFLVYAGFKYIASRGDEQEAATAKQQIGYALLGFIIILFAERLLSAFASRSAAGIESIITNYVDFFSALAGIIAVIFLVYAGFKYIASRGEEEEAATAKRQILYAIIGLFIIADANIIITAFDTTGAPSPIALINRIRTLVNAILAFAGIVAAIYIILSGVRYITSAGDEDEATKAKRQLLYAVIGIVIIVFATVLVNFFITAFIQS